MTTEYTLSAAVRSDQGKGASRRLRKTNMVPAIIYGAGEEPQSVALKANQFNRALDEEAFYSSVITLDIEGSATPVVLRDLQRHPAKPVILHADFQRIKPGERVRMVLPLHFLNEAACPGVKLQGGRAYHSLVRVETVCDAGTIPNYIEVDMAEMNKGDSVHLSDLVLPEGVVLPQLARGADHDLSVAAIH